LSTRLSTLVALTLCGLASLALAPPADAGWPGRNGRIAVIWNEVDRGGRDDTELRFVTDSRRRLGSASPCSRPEFDPDTGVCPGAPAWSPDGRRLALEQDSRLAVASPDGGGITTLPPFTELDAQPAWSPDGTRLVFTGTRAGARDLYVVRADGTGMERLTRDGGAGPAWSSRDRIAFVRKGVIYSLDPDSGERRRVARGSQPEWSPSGKSIAYKLGRNVYRVSVRSGKRHLLVRNAEGPAYSPTARRLLFERVIRNDFTPSLFIANANGSNPATLFRGGETPVGSTFDSWVEAAWRPLPRG
jgi:Tol biopolymer transport system component